MNHDIICFLLFLYLFKQKIEIVNNLANSGSLLKRTELLEKYFIQNPWYDVTNLDEMIKSTGIDDISIKVTFLFLSKKI
jgi:hypothetical protein